MDPFHDVSRIHAAEAEGASLSHPHRCYIPGLTSIVAITTSSFFNGSGQIHTALLTHTVRNFLCVLRLLITVTAEWERYANAHV